jgi:pentatricopeptide repeat protein
MPVAKEKRMKLLRWIAVSSCAMLGLVPGAVAIAADYNAELAYRLFTATCMRRLGKPEQIQAWAAQARLTPITEPSALNTFVGTTPGAKGAAWVLPSPNGRRFTLSIRAGTQACVLWAEAGDPETAEGLFRRMVEASVEPGMTLTTDDDQSFTTATGKARLLTMSVADKDGMGFQYTLKAGDRPGTFFAGAPVQLSLQMARLQP